MPRGKTREGIRAELRSKLPHFDGDFKTLETVLDRIERESPELERNITVFRMYYGLSGSQPSGLKEIQNVINLSIGQLSTLRRDLENILRRKSAWK